MLFSPGSLKLTLYVHSPGPPIFHNPYSITLNSSSTNRMDSRRSSTNKRTETSNQQEDDEDSECIDRSPGLGDPPAKDIFLADHRSLISPVQALAADQLVPVSVPYPKTRPTTLSSLHFLRSFLDKSSYALLTPTPEERDAIKKAAQRAASETNGSTVTRMERAKRRVHCL